LKGFYPIPGSTRPEGVQEALGSLDVRFDDKELKELRTIIDSADIKGGRYNAYFQDALVG
jgi:pyridoxine 4-dehydrogenase